MILPFVASGCFSIPDRSGNMEPELELLYYWQIKEKYFPINFSFLYSTELKSALTLCQTTMLCSMAHPQSTIPTLITILVVMAGVDGNWMMVYKTISEVGEKGKETGLLATEIRAEVQI